MSEVVRYETSAREIAPNLTLYCSVSGMRQWRWRIGIGMWLIRLAARVMWVNIEVEVCES